MKKGEQTRRQEWEGSEGVYSSLVTQEQNVWVLALCRGGKARELSRVKNALWEEGEREGETAKGKRRGENVP